MTGTTTAEALTARRLLDLWGTGAQDGAIAAPDMAAAYRVAAALRALREGRGERIAGRKIGFSNRAIWPLYGVDRPMWNYVWDTTLRAADAPLPLAGLPEPRIEPEVVFRLARAPRAGMDEAALFDCIDGVAFGFEIVQSVFPGWKFTAAQSAAAFGLHGALAIGPWRDPGADRPAWLAQLADFPVTLFRDGTAVETGHARNVLGGPLTALRFLVETLAEDPEAAPIAPGEIVTTGTLTDAAPVAPGQTWRMEAGGVALPGLRLRLA